MTIKKYGVRRFGNISFNALTRVRNCYTIKKGVIKYEKETH